MSKLGTLLQNNVHWSSKMKKEDPDFFKRLVNQQTPKYLWIGCSDSRVPANQIVGLLPGEVFVHRNVGNLVVHTDFNCLSVIQYAVEVLKVEHVIVCGHYGCGAVAAAMNNAQLGMIDNWLRHIRDVYADNTEQIDSVVEKEQRADKLCELNIAAQVAHVCQTTFVQNAWSRGQELTVHGLVYGINNGLIKELGLSISGLEDVARVYRAS